MLKSYMKLILLYLFFTWKMKFIKMTINNAITANGEVMVEKAHMPKHSAPRKGSAKRVIPTAPVFLKIPFDLPEVRAPCHALMTAITRARHAAVHILSQISIKIAPLISRAVNTIATSVNSEMTAPGMSHFKLRLK